VSAPLAVAFVWFTTHFGGGFASGRQVVEFYTRFGWYAVFLPILSMAIVAVVYYLMWRSAAQWKVFDYRSWADAYFGRSRIVFANVFEVLFNLLLITATAVAFATGGATLEATLGTPYILNTVAIAIVMFVLTIYGAEVVRRAASWMGLVIVAGLLLVYGSHVTGRIPALIEVLRSAPAPEGIGAALWSALVYAGLMSTLIGAMVAVADVLDDRRAVIKAVAWGFAINTGLLWLASLVLLADYPAILPEQVPLLYVIDQGAGHLWMKPVVSVLILLAVVTSGVNLIFGGTKRIVSAVSKNDDARTRRVANVVTSGLYVVITWAIALFGLIPLIARGYRYIGYIAVFTITLPVLAAGIIRRART
jgi:uncharacterized membrane protein YkvI